MIEVETFGFLVTRLPGDDEDLIRYSVECTACGFHRGRTQPLARSGVMKFTRHHRCGERGE